MWSIAGQELTGTYGNWNDRVYEVIVDRGPEIGLLLSAEAAPADGWLRRLQDDFWGEDMRWEWRVPSDEVSGIRSVLVETPICGKVFTVQAQRDDGFWALTRAGALDRILAARLGLTEAGGTWSGWVSDDEIVDFIRTPAAGAPSPV